MENHGPCLIHAHCLVEEKEMRTPLVMPEADKRKDFSRERAMVFLEIISSAFWHQELLYLNESQQGKEAFTR